jgi:RNA-directed DNA polymerase
MQLRLFSQAAEKTRKGTDGRADGDLLSSVPQAAAERESKTRTALPALEMEEIANESNLEEAFKNVASNKGAPGVDRESVEELKKRLPQVISELHDALRAGTYKPGDIRRVWIPKAGGGPNVIDRVVQQAVLQVMQPHYDPIFDDSSHGFRPKRSCHTAIAEAKSYVEDGYEWVVDIDLEKFFDTVNHQRLLSILEKKVSDRRILTLIKLMLKAKIVLPDGVVVKNEEGTPQGGPLSPLLSNIVLHELDEKLRERGHKFVRYADDCNIYVRSEAAGHRVMESTTRFIEKRLRLKVNRAKSAVAKPSERHFLGFRLEVDELSDTVHVRLSEKSKKKIDAKVRELTPRNWGQSFDECIKQINQYLNGWTGYFKICSTEEEYTFRGLDAHIRRRLRAIQLKHWKSKKGIASGLIRMGARPKAAWRQVYAGHTSLWSLSHTSVVDRTLRNAFFAARGLVSIGDRWRQLHSIFNVQMPLAFG